MAVRIRLKKTGKKNDMSFRIAVIPQSSGRDSSTIEELGFYDPRRSNESINVERYDYWCSVGALPTDTVSAIAKRAKAGKGKTLADHKTVMAAKEAANPVKRRARKTVEAAPAPAAEEPAAEA